MKAETTFSLKDQLFNKTKVAYLAGRIKDVHSDFDQRAFKKEVVSALPDLALKECITHISICLEKYLPASYPESLTILIAALPEELDPEKKDDDFGDFIFAPLSYFVAINGCSKQHLSRSLQALKEMTKRFSAEYAIRFFINAFPDETFDFLAQCATDKHYHVRRLASEGTRPKLPWAHKLVTDWERPLPILNTLHSDSTRFVTRSVANHLNDISKVAPDAVVEVLARWSKEKKQSSKEMDYMCRHSLRTLEKKGHRGALKTLGYGAKPDIVITGFKSHTPLVEIGTAFEFTLTLTANKNQALLIDYLVQFPSDKKRNSEKIFKLKKLTLKAGESVALSKKHPMKLMTTRRLSLGEHTVTLQINGYTFDSLSFDLISP